jgi:hypothetical protein
MFRYINPNQQLNFINEVKLLKINQKKEYTFKNTKSFSIDIGNDENDLVLKFPIKNNLTNTGIYLQCIKNFFKKTNEQKDKIISDILNELKITTGQNFLIIDKNSKLFLHYEVNKDKTPSL